MSIITLATSISVQAHPFYTTWSYDTPGNRLAVPLTTAWTFPKDCTIENYLAAVGTGTCSPPYFSEISSYDGYYSPGVCYLGYTIGCIATGTNVNFEPVKPLETVAFCVPRDYECDIYEENGYDVIAYGKPAQTVTSVVWAIALQIRWQSSDSVALGSLYVPSSVVASILQRSTSTLGSEATGQTRSMKSSTTGGTRETIGVQETTGSSGGLSSGHIAAIAVCVVVVVFGTLLATFIVFRLKRKQLGATSSSQSPTSDGNTLELPSTPGQEKAELPATSRGIQVVLPMELVNEMPIQHRTPELSGSLLVPVTELPGDRDMQAHSPGQPSSVAGGGVDASTPSPRGQQSADQADQEVEDLMAQQTLLEEKRRRLLELQQIDEDQEKISQRLTVLRQERQRIQPHELP